MVTPNKNSIENRIEELLAAQADALIAGDDSFEIPWAQYKFEAEDVADTQELLTLASQLRLALTPIDPSTEFMSRLHDELTGQAPVTLLVRWRKLPASYQLAAKLGGMAITAGIVALAAARGLNVISTLTHRDNGTAETKLSAT